MRSKIEEIISLYNKEFEIEDKNGSQLSARRLTFEEILNNRKKSYKNINEDTKV